MVVMVVVFLQALFLVVDLTIAEYVLARKGMRADSIGERRIYVAYQVPVFPLVDVEKDGVHARKPFLWIAVIEDDFGVWVCSQ